jgi:hypothetical protein
MADHSWDATEAGAPDPADAERERQKAAADKRAHKAALDKLSKARRKNAAAAAASGAGAPDPADTVARERKQAAAEEGKIRQKAQKAAWDKAYRARKRAAELAAASGAAGSASLSRFSEAAARASQTRAEPWDSDVGPGVPARYHVSRTIVPRPHSPELRPAGVQTVLEKKALLELALQQFTLTYARRYTTSRAIVHRPPSPESRLTRFQTIMDHEPLLEMVLRHFTRNHAKHLLAPTCRQLAASVRGEKVPWKAEFESFEFCSEDLPDLETVHALFAQAYPFYSRDALDPCAAWLLEELCRADLSVEDKWEVVFECVPHEEYMGSADEGRTPAEVTDAYKEWLAKPNRRWDVWDMKTLSDKIERKCLEHISPFCWQSWKDPPVWCPRVRHAFDRWQAKLPFNIDVDRINSESILARLDEGTFRGVEMAINRKIGNFTNWNQFAYALLKECHVHYQVPQDHEWDDSYADVRGDFERDEGADFEDPDFDDE